MDKSDLPLDQPANQDIVTGTDSARHREDLTAFWVRPPATPNWLACDDLNKRQGRALRGFKYDTVLTNEGESLAWSHLHEEIRNRADLSGASRCFILTISEAVLG